VTEAEFAAELRTFARRLKALRFRGTEAYLQDIDALAYAMVRRASEISADVPAVARAPQHARLALRQTRIVGPTGAVATVTLRRQRGVDRRGESRTGVTARSPRPARLRAS
jgi:hypothetical protein